MVTDIESRTVAAITNVTRVYKPKFLLQMLIRDGTAYLSYHGTTVASDILKDVTAFIQLVHIGKVMNVGQRFCHR